MEIPPEVQSAESFIIHITVHVKPDKVDEFLTSLKPAYEKAIALDEVTSFDIYEVAGQPGVFVWMEHWNAKFTSKAVGDWMTSDTLKKIMEDTDPLMAKPKELRFLKPKKL